MARLNAELTDTRQLRSKSPRRKFISANTRQYEFASYMQAWVAKVERVGNLNYPDQARQRNLSGSLIMTVGIHIDGSIESITIQQPSGHDILDQAAQQIVQIAAPYAPLPPEDSPDNDQSYLSCQFLIAMPGMGDPNFTNGVTLMCKHNEEGAIGITINRPSNFTLFEVMRQLNIHCDDESKAARSIPNADLCCTHRPRSMNPALQSMMK
jgi:TonB family protein